MIEDKFSVARLVENNGQMSEALRPSAMDVTISIGRENSTREAEDLTIVSTPYYAGSMVGRLGILGPKRMDYEHAVRVLNYMSDSLTATLTDTNQQQD
jgi:heat-inducible transcriptional repressor